LISRRWLFTSSFIFFFFDTLSLLDSFSFFFRHFSLPLLIGLLLAPPEPPASRLHGLLLASSPLIFSYRRYHWRFSHIIDIDIYAIFAMWMCAWDFPCTVYFRYCHYYQYVFRLLFFAAAFHTLAAISSFFFFSYWLYATPLFQSLYYAIVIYLAPLIIFSFSFFDIFTLPLSVSLVASPLILYCFFFFFFQLEVIVDMSSLRY